MIDFILEEWNQQPNVRYYFKFYCATDIYTKSSEPAEVTMYNRLPHRATRTQIIRIAKFARIAALGR